MFLLFDSLQQIVYVMMCAVILSSGCFRMYAKWYWPQLPLLFFSHFARVVVVWGGRSVTNCHKAVIKWCTNWEILGARPRAPNNERSEELGAEQEPPATATRSQNRDNRSRRYLAEDVAFTPYNRSCHHFIC
eukprot:scaffold44604_cov46-Cyclotella_meneghiniana.AAC.3